MDKTVRVRIALAINSEGEWNVQGYNDETDHYLQLESNWDNDPDITFHWIEADIPIPEVIEEQVFKGEVSDG